MQKWLEVLSRDRLVKLFEYYKKNDKIIYYNEDNIQLASLIDNYNVDIDSKNFISLLNNTCSIKISIIDDEYIFYYDNQKSEISIKLNDDIYLSLWDIDYNEFIKIYKEIDTLELIKELEVLDEIKESKSNIIYFSYIDEDVNIKLNRIYRRNLMKFMDYCINCKHIEIVRPHILINISKLSINSVQHIGYKEYSNNKNNLIIRELNYRGLDTIVYYCREFTEEETNEYNFNISIKLENLFNVHYVCDEASIKYIFEFNEYKDGERREQEEANMLWWNNMPDEGKENYINMLED